MSAKKKYKISSEVWRYPGMAGWHFVHVDKKQSAMLKETYAEAKRGFGSIPVKVSMGKAHWETSIFPDKRSGTYVLPLKAAVRKAEGIEAGDNVIFTLIVR